MTAIAIIGAGQLAQMMARAGQPLGLKFVFLAEAAEEVSCVEGLGSVVRIPEKKTEQTIALLFEQAGRPNIVTVEKEHVDLELMRFLDTLTKVRPSVQALTIAKNRLAEKTFLQSVGVPIADFHEVRDQASAQKAFEAFEYNGFLKSQEEGYDGYHQWRVTDKDSAAAALAEIPSEGRWVFERAVAFDCELSFLFVCEASGEISAYDPAWNTHREGQLLSSIVPAPQSNKDLESVAAGYASAIQNQTGYVGVLSIECFLVGDQLLVNEIAPRVHNSGHWSMHGALTSQFESHIRAVAGLPLTDLKRQGYCAMVNCLGREPKAKDLSSSRAFLYSYGKSARPRRKLGHVNVVCDTSTERDELVAQLVEMIYQSST